MIYEEINKNIRALKDERFRTLDNSNYEYAYLEEELYCVKEKDNERLIFVRAKSPLEAFNKAIKQNLELTMKSMILFENVISLIKHTLGLDDSRREFKVYRNYYDNGDKPNYFFEQLVQLGYATKLKNKNYYLITEKGTKFIERLLNVRLKK